MDTPTPKPPDESAKRAAYIAGLRELADFLQSTPALQTPNGILEINIWCYSKPDFVEQARALGVFDKRSTSELLILQRKFGPGVVVEINAHHDQVCTRVVETKIVTRKQPTAFETRQVEQQVPVKFEEVEEIVEVVKWECPKSILNANE